jgi:hypothetical protein
MAAERRVYWVQQLELMTPPTLMQWLRLWKPKHRLKIRALPHGELKD